MAVKRQHSLAQRGCVLSAIAFCIFFSLTLTAACKDWDKGIPVHFRTHGSFFYFQFMTFSRVYNAAVAREYHADDCALMAHSGRRSAPVQQFPEYRSPT